MKIWIIEIGEPLPMEGGVRLLRYGRFAPYLVKQGHEVTWLACDFSHAPKKHVVPENSSHNHEGVTIHCLHAPGYKSNLSLARLWHHHVYAKALKKHLAERIKAEGKPDLIINPLPTIANIDVVSKFCKDENIPYIVDIRDDWPEYFVIKLPRFIRSLANFIMRPVYHKVMRACRDAAGICGCSSAQLEYGLKMAGRERDELRDLIFYHGYSAQKISEAHLPPAREFWREQGVDPDAFIISFIGTLGFSVSLDVVIPAILQANKDGRKIQLVLCGRGGQFDELQKLAQQYPDQIIVPGWVNAAQIQVLMEMSKVGLLPYLPVSNMSMPNKIFEYMAGGLATISSCGGESADVLRTYDCGLIYDHNSMETFEHCLNIVMDDPLRLTSMQKNARAVFDEKFSYEKLYPTMQNYLKRIAGA